MKLGKFGQRLKASVRKHYVRKKEFEALNREVDRLAKKLAKLEKSAESSGLEKPEAGAKPKKKNKKPVKAATQVVETSQDKLTAIRGIGPVLEKKLHGLGITRLSQIAAWSEEDIDKISAHLSFKGRIQREDWIKQAKELVL